MKKKFVKITRFGQSCIMSFENALEEVELFYEEASSGEAIIWENVELNEKEYGSLSEFQGW